MKEVGDYGLGWKPISGVTLLAKATGVTRKTIAKGVKEILKPKEEKLRKDGGGRKNKKEEYPELIQLEILI